MRVRREPSLLRVFVAIVVVLGLALLVYEGITWMGEAKAGIRLDKGSLEERLDRAKQFKNEGKGQEARQLLEPLVAQVQNQRVREEALVLLAEAQSDAQEIDSALQSLARLVTEFQGSSNRPQYAIRYGRLLEKLGRYEEARAMYQEIRASAPAELRAPALSGLARAEERADRLEAALGLYAEAFRGAERDSEAWNEALDGLGRLNAALIFSPHPTSESKEYVVQKGDNFTSIGIKLNTTLGLLTRPNGMTEDTPLRVGQRLKWTPKDFRIVIERSTCRLFLLDNKGVFKRYMVGLGKPGHETTLGSYRIGNKEKNPTWHKPGVGPIPPNDPANELGTRWMPLVPEQEGLPKDLGIHGSLDPAAVGKYSTNGCARLLMEEVEELYDLVVRATPVQIVEALDPGMLLPTRVAAN